MNKTPLTTGPARSRLAAHRAALALAAALCGPAWAQAPAAAPASGAAAPASAAVPDTPGTPDAPRVLLIGQLGGPSAGVDERIAQHLRARGYAVTQADQHSPPDAATGMALVLISSTVAAKAMHPGWRHVPVPLLTWENDFLDDLAMTGKRSGTDYGEAGKERYLWLVNAPHPLAGGLPAGTANVYVGQAPMSWGKPGLVCCPANTYT